MTSGRPDAPTLAEGAQGVFTLLFTDIEDSTRLWEAHQDDMERAVRAHNEHIAAIVEGARGAIVRFMGDGVFALFVEAGDAVAAAVDIQREFSGRRWPGVGELRLRAGLNTGPCRIHGGEVFGRAPNLAARLEAAGHGGQILMSGSTATACAGRLRGDEQLFDLGRYHIRGFASPVAVHSVLADGLRSRFGPLRTPYRGFDELPSDGSRTRGRQELIESVEALLADHPVVTLWGPSGVGKTRVALEVARGARRPYSDGVRFVDLSALAPERAAASPLDRVLGPVAAALRAQPVAGEAVLATVTRVLRSSQLLLVLDNCESVLAGVCQVAAMVVEQCSGVRVLATSREALRVSGEVAVEVVTLPVPPPGEDDLDRVASFDVVGLFVERAHAAEPGFVLGAANAGSVAALCRALDGLPLAVELAASRLDVESVEDLVADVPSLLTRLEADPGSDTRRSIWGSLRWAISRLAPADVDLFVRLGVFAGGFPRHVAVAVSGRGPAAERSLDRLVRTSLVVRDTTTPGRFRLLASAREFARNLVAPPEWERCRSAHAVCMLDRAESYESRLRTHDEADAVRAIQGDFADSRVAVELLFERGDLEGISRWVVALFQYAVLAPRPEVHGWALALADRLDDDAPLAAEVVGAAALGAWFAGDTEQAVISGARAVRLAADHGGSTTWARTAMFDALAYVGRIEEASEHFVALIDEHRRGDDPYWQVHGRSFEAIAQSMLGRPDAAERRASQALDLARRLGNSSCTQWALYALGRVYAPKEPVAACAAFEQAMEVAREVESRWAIALSLVEWVEVKRRLGDTGAAASGAADLLEILATSGNRSQLSQVLRETGHALADAGRLDLAALVLLARRGLPAMPKSVRDAPEETAQLDGLRVSLGDVWPALEVRARTMREHDLIALCRRELAMIARSEGAST